MKKADKILLAVITLSAAVFFIGGICAGLSSQESGSVTVYADNEVMAEYSLKEDGEYDIVTPYGHNLLTIKNGEAYVTETDCPGGDCMKMKTDAKGGSIICLPHHLVIKTGDGRREGIDAIAR
ncbi:MAG: NusG domain II-containing protein [Lachnospiraceae bacterium]|nr:NusG domain II-containing protein [Lachnospiraceae bacterium]